MKYRITTALALAAMIAPWTAGARSVDSDIQEMFDQQCSRAVYHLVSNDTSGSPPSEWITTFTVSNTQYLVETPTESLGSTGTFEFQDLLGEWDVGEDDYLDFCFDSDNSLGGDFRVEMFLNLRLNGGTGNVIFILRKAAGQVLVDSPDQRSYRINHQGASTVFYTRVLPFILEDLADGECFGFTAGNLTEGATLEITGGTVVIEQLDCQP